MLVLLQERIRELATGSEVLAYEPVRRLAYTVALRSACGDLLSQATVDELFDDFQVVSEGVLAPVRSGVVYLQDAHCVSCTQGCCSRS